MLEWEKKNMFGKTPENMSIDDLLKGELYKPMVLWILIYVTKYLLTKQVS